MPGKFDLIKDLADLARAGYKPSDVKDILESLRTDPDLKQEGGNDLKEKAPEESKKKEPEKKDPEEKKDNLDALAEIIKRESEDN